MDVVSRAVGWFRSVVAAVAVVAVGCCASNAAAAGLVAAGLLGGANADGTHIVKIASHVSIRSHGLTFSGKVTSPNNACIGMRTVTLHLANGNVVGHTHTNSHGRWKITAHASLNLNLFKLLLDYFYATVKRTRQGAAGTIYVCKHATSRTIAPRVVAQRG
jgi:hypothetical protein